MKAVPVTSLWLLFLLADVQGQVAVIAHKDVPSDTIKKSELLDFYTGDIKTWSNATPVIVFDLKPKGKIKDLFYNFLGKSSSRMKSVWLKKMLSGEGDPPQALQSQEDLLEKVASTPGAVSYIEQTKVSNQVKVLLVIKKKET